MRAFALHNASGDSHVSEVLPVIAAALTRQGADVGDFWQRQGIPVVVVEDPATTDIETALCSIYLDAAQAGELGDHSFDGRILARVFWGPIQANGGTLTTGASSLSATCSHEYVEPLIDPYANCWVDRGEDGMQEALEPCDRTEGDSYAINAIAVSNFLGPRAFRDGVGPFDWMGLLKEPWEIRPAGYVLQRSASGDVRAVFGEKFPAWKVSQKARHSLRWRARGTLTEPITHPEGKRVVVP